MVYAGMNDAYRTRTADAVAGVRSRLGDDVSVVFRHHTVDEQTTAAAVLLEAATAEGKFRPMHDVRNGTEMSRVEDDDIDAAAAGLPDEPTVHVNGRRVTGPVN